MVCRFLKIHNNFMLILWFFLYFADFWANFCDFLPIVLFYFLKWVLKGHLLLEPILDANELKFFWI